MKTGHLLMQVSHLVFHHKIKNSIAYAILFLMARRKGLEPLTFWFVARHSIQLSYERVCSVLFNSENYINTRAVKKQPFSALIFQGSRSKRGAVFPSRGTTIRGSRLWSGGCRRACRVRAAPA